MGKKIKDAAIYCHLRRRNNNTPIDPWRIVDARFANIFYDTFILVVIFSEIHIERQTDHYDWDRYHSDSTAR